MINKIKIQYLKISQPVKASFYFFLGICLQQGINFILTPILAKILSLEDFGMINLYNSWQNLLTIILSLNLGSGLFQQGLIEYENKRNEFISVTQGLNLIFTMIFFIIFLLFSDFFYKILKMPKILIFMIFLNIFFYPSYQYFLNLKKFEYDYISILKVTILVILSNLLSVILIKYFFIEKALAKIILNQLFLTILYLVIAIKIILKGKKIIDIKIWKELLRYGIPLLPHYISHMILGQSDRLMIDYFFGKEEVGVYSIAYMVGMVMNLLIVSVTSIFNPWTFRMLKENKIEEIDKNSKILIKYFFIINVFIILIIPDIFKIIFNEEFYPALNIIPSLILSTFFQFCSTFFTNIEFYYKKSYYITLASLIAALSNIFLNYIYLPKYGFLFAGYTTLISYFIFLIIHYLIYRYICRENIYSNKFYLKYVILNILFCFISKIISQYSMLRRGIIILLSIYLIIELKIIINEKRKK